MTLFVFESPAPLLQAAGLDRGLEGWGPPTILPIDTSNHDFTENLLVTQWNAGQKLNR
ncbi:MAG: hypothetical protein OXI61_17125 [Candidatus Poribacteria bacterium]|nr:hypothetical protein [Candidatus Poribacteria bacterium]